MQVHQAVLPRLAAGLAADNQYRRRLFAAQVTTDRLRRFQRHQQPFRQRPGCLLKSLCHRLRHTRLDHQVCLHRKILTRQVTRVLNTVFTRMGGCLATGINHGNLAYTGVGICCQQCIQGT